MHEIKTIEQAQDFIYSFIPSEKENTVSPAFKLARTKFMLNLLGNPQNNIKAIHVAGTSGKGSTSYLVSTILVANKFKVGLYTSPHLYDIRERIQIQNKYISEEEFINALNHIIPTLEKTSKSPFGKPMFFDILTVMAFYIFDKEKLDYAVIETGLGGMYDATNTTSNQEKISVITKLGYDHTEILGETIEEIALQKAGIININSHTFTISQENNAKFIIENYCKLQNSKLTTVYEKENFNIIKITKDSTVFEFQKNKYTLGLIGKHQAENCSLALSVCKYLSTRDKFKFDFKSTQYALSQTKYKGRFEIIRKAKNFIILDGAHNPQKIQTLVDTLKTVFSGHLFMIILAFKEGKKFRDMIEILLPITNKIILTQFEIGKFKSINNSEIISLLKAKKFKNFEEITDLKKVSDIVKKEKQNIVITGSFYLVGSIYKYLNKK